MFENECAYDSLEKIKLCNVRDTSSTDDSNLSNEVFFTLLDTVFNVIEYTGDIVGAVSKIPNARVFVIDENYAILAIRGNIQEVLDKLFDVINIVILSALHTLCDISPVEASGADIFHNNPYLALDGSGVIVGIIDTGIDYLNEEFINEDGTSRIIAIWDQNIASGKKPNGQFGGSEYTREEINMAIRAKKDGKDPYSIVPSKDEIGHGTKVAGIVGARGANPALIGVAPRCDFAVVSLGPAPQYLKSEFGVYGDAPTFSTSVVFTGIKYLSDLAQNLKKPMVILLPLESSTGARNGQSFIERYIDQVSRTLGITVVVPVGNQGDADNHTSGIIAKRGYIANVELKVSKNQHDLLLEVWVHRPDKVSLSIVSPTGEVIERIAPKENPPTEVKFLYEETRMYIKYYIPEQQTGDERIRVIAKNIKDGIWIFRLIGDLILVGRYDCYLIQRSLLAPDTKFLSPDSNLTITTIATSDAAISVASYNQNNNSNVTESGKGYTRDGRIKPDIAAGGVNAVTTAVGGGTSVISGTSVAAAVVAGSCALVYQWGVVLGNDRVIYSTKIKTYLIRGTRKIEGEKFPNPQLGYGIIDMKGIFDNIRLAINEPKGKVKSITYEVNEYSIGNLFIRLPIECS